MKKEISKILINQADIQAMVERLAAEIEQDYAGKELIMIGVLKGSVPFMSDLMRAVDLDVVIDFISVSSYKGTRSTGIVRILKDTDIDVSGKHVLLVEDIVDTGLTLAYLRELFKDRKPASLAVCTAFDKPERREIDVDVEYIGQSIPNEFVVGYGLDYDQKYRNLPYLGVLAEDHVDSETKE